MGSVKPSVKPSSRSRGLPHSGPPSKDAANKLQENLNVFKSDNFDGDSYVQSKCTSLNEKGDMESEGSLNTLLHNNMLHTHSESRMESENSKSFEDLPKRLVMDILSRLPVKSLIRSTSVRKEWYSIIKSVSFISLHLSRSVSDPRSYVCLNNLSSMFSLVKDNNLLTHDSPERSIFEFIIGNDNPPRKVFVSSRRGLVCIADRWWEDDGYGIYLFNPFIRKYKEIELQSSCHADLIREMKPNKRKPSKGDVIRIDFGYSDIEDDYKVLRMIIPKNKKKRTTKAEIYSLKSDKWKCVDIHTEIEIDVMDPDVCVLGSLYWVIKNDTRYLLCFDLKVQVFSKIKLPKPYLELPVSQLFNKNDSLVILLREKLEDCVSGELEMCLLTLEEKNVEGHKWKECSYTFSSNDINWKSDPKFNFLGFTIDGRLILSVHQQCVRCSMARKLPFLRIHRDIGCVFDKNIMFAVDLNNKCGIEKFKFNFSKHLIKGFSGVEFIDGATNVLESLILFSD